MPLGMVLEIVMQSVPLVGFEVLRGPDSKILDQSDIC